MSQIDEESNADDTDENMSRFIDDSVDTRGPSTRMRRASKKHFKSSLSCRVVIPQSLPTSPHVV